MADTGAHIRCRSAGRSFQPRRQARLLFAASLPGIGFLRLLAGRFCPGIRRFSSLLVVTHSVCFNSGFRQLIPDTGRRRPAASFAAAAAGAGGYGRSRISPKRGKRAKISLTAGPAVILQGYMQINSAFASFFCLLQENICK